MDALLRRYAEWRGRCRAAQVIVFDGGAEVERTRSFLKGAMVGIGLSLFTLSLAAPGSVDPELLREMDRREALVHEANVRVQQAAAVTEVCLRTAHEMEGTLGSYRQMLGSR